MKRLEKFLRPYRRESILAPLFKLLEVVFDLMVPVVVAQIIDVGVAKNDRGYIVEMFFVLLLMAATTSFVSGFRAVPLAASPKLWQIADPTNIPTTVTAESEEPCPARIS